MDMKYYYGNIEEETIANENFRKVIWTGKMSQLVLMALKPGEEIGLETHPQVDQFFRIESGKGKAVVGGLEFELSDGKALTVPAGTEHNIVNTGDKPLKLYTLYSPANHLEGVAHRTKKEALSDIADEEFGHKD